MNACMHLIVIQCLTLLIKIYTTYSHGQELFYKFVSDFTNKLVKQLLSMTVHQDITNYVLKFSYRGVVHVCLFGGEYRITSRK